MSIDVTCTGCSRRYRLKPELAGRTMRCKECGTVIAVPAGPAHNGADAAVRPARSGGGRGWRSSPVVWLGAGVVTLLIIAGVLILALGGPDWQAFTTPDGAVTVQFPGDPGENNVRDMRKWQAGSGEGQERRIYVLGVRRAGPSPTGRWTSWQRTLARSLRERYVSSLVSGWEPCGEEPVMMGPHHGVQLEYCPDGRRGNDVGHVVARLFVVRDASIVVLGQRRRRAARRRRCARVLRIPARR